MTHAPQTIPVRLMLRAIIHVWAQWPDLLTVSRAIASTCRACAADIYHSIHTCSQGRESEVKMLVQKLNPVTGEYEWVVVDTADLDMLTDTRRNKAYAMALDRVMQDILAREANPTVLDIGTGTGLLAMMACKTLLRLRQQQQPAESTVLACEVFPPMARLAQRVIQANQLDMGIKVVCKRSDELNVGPAAEADAAHAKRAPKQQAQPDLPAGGVSLVVSEILDSALLGEGVLPTMRHAADHLMKHNAPAIPARAVMWGQLVECNALWNMASLSPPDSTQCLPNQTSADCTASQKPSDATADESDAQLISMLRNILSTLRDLDAESIIKEAADAATGASANLVWQDLKELHVGPLWSAGLLTPLSTPVKLLSLDLTRPPTTNLASHNIQVPVTHVHGGQLHALVYWWQLFLDDAPDTDLVLSTAPPWVGSSLQAGGDGGPTAGVVQCWRDHWAQCWAPLGGPAPQQVLPGQVVNVSVRHDDLSVQVALTHQAPDIKRQSQQVLGGSSQSLSTTALPALRMWLAPHLIAQLQEEQRWLTYMHALHRLLPPEMHSPSSCKHDHAHSCEPEQQQQQQQQGTVVTSRQHSFDIVTLGAGIMLPVLAASIAQHAQHTQHAEQASTGRQPTHVTALIDNPVEQRWVQAAVHALGRDAAIMRITKPGPYWKRLQHAGCSQSSVTANGHASLLPEQRTVVVLSEPRFMEAEGGLPWVPMLRCWNDMSTIRRAHPDARVVCIPSHAIIRCVALALPELWRTRRRLDMVEGLDLSVVNSFLGAVGVTAESGVASAGLTALGDGFTPCQTLDPLPYALWQCGDSPSCTELSNRQELMHVAIGRDDVCGWEGSTELCIAGSSQPVHAVALWVDYEAHTATEHGITTAETYLISNSPRLNGTPSPAVGKQAILLLHQPIQAGVGGRLRVRVEFNAGSCDVNCSLAWKTAT